MFKNNIKIYFVKNFILKIIYSILFYNNINYFVILITYLNYYLALKTSWKFTFNIYNIKFSKY